MIDTYPPNISVVSDSSNSRGIALIVLESCILLVLDISALVGNVLVCLAWYRNPSLRTVTNIFILSLALTDLLMAVLVMPLKTASSIANKWIAEAHGCNLYGIATQILAGTSLLTVMLLAINRYFRVVRPASYPNIFTKKHSTVMAACAWIVTALLLGVGFRAAGTRSEVKPINPTKCFIVFPIASLHIFFHVVRSVYIAVPSLVIVFCYVKIYKTIHQHNTAQGESTQAESSPYGVVERKLTRLLTFISVGFYLCWLPVLLTSISRIWLKFPAASSHYNFYYYNFPVYVSSVINPIILATVSQPFRTEFLKILRGL